jgi:hypothetical protein
VTTFTPYETPHDAAAAARALLDNKALVAAFENLEREYFDQWRSTPANETKLLRAIKGRMDSLSALKSDLEAMMHSGKVADFNNKSKRK